MRERDNADQSPRLSSDVPAPQTCPAGHRLRTARLAERVQGALVLGRGPGIDARRFWWGASGSFFWWDELAKARRADLGWSNMLFGMREGNPRGIVTTTPRAVPLLKKLLKSPSTRRL
jgi:hypothetical protein